MWVPLFVYAPPGPSLLLLCKYMSSIQHIFSFPILFVFGWVFIFYIYSYIHSLVHAFIVIFYIFFSPGLSSNSLFLYFFTPLFFLRNLVPSFLWLIPILCIPHFTSPHTTSFTHFHLYSQLYRIFHPKSMSFVPVPSVMGSSQLVSRTPCLPWLLRFISLSPSFASRLVLSGHSAAFSPTSLKYIDYELFRFPLFRRSFPYIYCWLCLTVQLSILPFTALAILIFVVFCIQLRTLSSF